MRGLRIKTTVGMASAVGEPYVATPCLADTSRRRRPGDGQNLVPDAVSDLPVSVATKFRAVEVKPLAPGVFPVLLDDSPKAPPRRLNNLTAVPYLEPTDTVPVKREVLPGESFVLGCFPPVLAYVNEQGQVEAQHYTEVARLQSLILPDSDCVYSSRALDRGCSPVLPAESAGRNLALKVQPLEKLMAARQAARYALLSQTPAKPWGIWTVPHSHEVFIGYERMDFNLEEALPQLDALRSTGAKGAQTCEDITVMELRGALQQTNHLHASGIVHRDLKPGNITHSLALKCAALVDFDSATPVLSGDMQTVAGTPSYFPPEEVDHSEQLDAKIDMWSLGLVAYEMLVGRQPFDVRHLDWSQQKFELRERQKCFDSRTDPARQAMSPPMAELVYDLMLKNNPAQRASARDCLNFLDTHFELDSCRQGEVEAFWNQCNLDKKAEGAVAAIEQARCRTDISWVII